MCVCACAQRSNCLFIDIRLWKFRELLSAGPKFIESDFESETYTKTEYSVILRLFIEISCYYSFWSRLWLLFLASEMCKFCNQFICLVCSQFVLLLVFVLCSLNVRWWDFNFIDSTGKWCLWNRRWSVETNGIGQVEFWLWMDDERARVEVVWFQCLKQKWRKHLKGIDDFAEPLQLVHLIKKEKSWFVLKIMIVAACLVGWLAGWLSILSQIRIVH